VMGHSIRIAATAHKVRYQVAHEAASHLRLKEIETAGVRRQKARASFSSLLPSVISLGKNSS